MRITTPNKKRVLTKCRTPANFSRGRERNQRQEGDIWRTVQGAEALTYTESHAAGGVGSVPINLPVTLTIIL